MCLRLAADTIRPRSCCGVTRRSSAAKPITHEVIPNSLRLCIRACICVACGQTISGASAACAHSQWGLHGAPIQQGTGMYVLQYSPLALDCVCRTTQAMVCPTKSATVASPSGRNANRRFTCARWCLCLAGLLPAASLPQGFGFAVTAVPPVGSASADSVSAAVAVIRCAPVANQVSVACSGRT
jgi:hypothetical protein